MYSKLKTILAGKHNMLPFEYPGHGTREGEALYDSVDYIIEDMFEQMKKNDTGAPFVLLGYSLGTKLVYLLYERFKDSVMFRRMKGLFFCASSMADIDEEKDFTIMSDEEIIDYTLDLGGSKIESEEDYEIFKQFVPVLRNDFILYEKTKKKIIATEHEPINKKVFVLYSSEEKNIKCYDKFCAEAPEYKYFEGEHFFINDYSDEMAEFINEKITKNIGS